MSTDRTTRPRRGRARRFSDVEFEAWPVTPRKAFTPEEEEAIRAKLAFCHARQGMKKPGQSRAPARSAR